MVKGSEVPDYDTFRDEAVYQVELPEPFVPFKKQIEDPEHHPFPTPSGKIEIYSGQLAAINDPLIPAIPKYIDPSKTTGHSGMEKVSFTDGESKGEASGPQPA